MQRIGSKRLLGELDRLIEFSQRRKLATEEVLGIAIFGCQLQRKAEFGFRRLPVEVRNLE